jgi:hypothetical protein
VKTRVVGRPANRHRVDDTVIGARVLAVARDARPVLQENPKDGRVRSGERRRRAGKHDEDREKLPDHAHGSEAIILLPWPVRWLVCKNCGSPVQILWTSCGLEINIARVQGLMPRF